MFNYINKKIYFTRTTCLVILLFSLCACLKTESITTNSNDSYHSTRNDTVVQIKNFKDIKFSTITDISFSKKVNLTLKNSNGIAEKFRLYSSDGNGNLRLIVSGNSTKNETTLLNQQFNLPLSTQTILLKSYKKNGGIISSQKIKLNNNSHIELRI